MTDIAWVYILKRSDDSFYTGKTSDLEERLADHMSGKYGGYTSTRRPVTLLFSQAFASHREAIEAERKIKGWSRAKKQALIDGNFRALHELAKCKNASHYRSISSLDSARDEL
jgi:predicted GIY-YIG superfamily endonuclease